MYVELQSHSKTYDYERDTTQNLEDFGLKMLRYL